MNDTFQQSIEADGNMLLFLFLIALIVLIFHFVLFFKIWFMTNDVASIKELLQTQMDLEHPRVKDDSKNNLDKDDDSQS